MVDACMIISDKIKKTLRNEKLFAIKEENYDDDSSDTSVLIEHLNEYQEKNTKIISVYFISVLYSFCYLIMMGLYLFIMLSSYQSKRMKSLHQCFTVLVALFGIINVYFLNKITHSIIMMLTGIISHIFIIINTYSVIYSFDMIIYFSLIYNFFFLIKAANYHFYITNIRIILFIYFVSLFAINHYIAVNDYLPFTLMIINGVAFSLSFYELKNQNIELYIGNHSEPTLKRKNNNEYYCKHNEF